MLQKLFIGLGNVGSRFDGTRHNLGIEALRAWAGDAVWRTQEKFQAEVATVQKDEHTATCLFPLTMMNESGRAVAAYLNYHHLAVEDVLAIHDDLELPLGEIEYVAGGSAKGHNGVRSIQAMLETIKIPRLRLGIGRPPEPMAVNDFVLSRFSADEEAARQYLIGAAGQFLDARSS